MHNQNKITLSSAAYQQLISHLVNIEDHLDGLIDEYFPSLTIEREEFSELIAKYINELNAVMGKISVSADSGNIFPFVIIGSEVTIKDLDDQETYQYCISLPYQKDTRKRYISYMSPVGRALLLKRTGEQVSVQIPNGISRYQIESIRLYA